MFFGIPFFQPPSLSLARSIWFYFIMDGREVEKRRKKKHFSYFVSRASYKELLTAIKVSPDSLFIPFSILEISRARSPTFSLLMLRYYIMLNEYVRRGNANDFMLDLSGNALFYYLYFFSI
jgi:hypothetical protein